MPKSTRQISPGRVLPFILCFHPVEHLESLKSQTVTFGEHRGVFFSFDEAAHDFSTVVVR